MKLFDGRLSACRSHNSRNPTDKGEQRWGVESAPVHHHRGGRGGGGLAGWHMPARASLAQAPLAGVPDEILNPVEVSGAEAEPIIGRLPGRSACMCCRPTPANITASAVRS